MPRVTSQYYFRSAFTSRKYFISSRSSQNLVSWQKACTFRLTTTINTGYENWEVEIGASADTESQGPKRASQQNVSFFAITNDAGISIHVVC
eukprot:m.124379 g.124379  ORF g.124379 m.124379 type:complete len:92 (+) comp15593_c1_seq2:1169-1444(+)